MALAVGIPGIPCVIASGGGGGISPPAGQIGGTAGSPTVLGIRETSGPTLLTIGTITDGEYLKRSGSTLISGTPAGGGGILGVDTFVAESLDIPYSNQTVTTRAFVQDSVGNTAMQIAAYLAAADSGLTELLVVPAGAANVKVETLWQASAAPGATNVNVQWRLGTRTTGTTGANSNFDLSVQAANNDTGFKLFSQAVVLGGGGGQWNISAGQALDLEIIRLISSPPSNSMTQAANLKFIRFTWT